MTQVIYTSSNTLSIAGISGVSLVIDTGSNHGNVKIPFSILDTDLTDVFSSDSGGDDFIHINIGGTGGSISISPFGGSFIFVDVDDGTVELDNGSGGSPVASTATEPTVTINYTLAGPTGDQAWPRKTFPEHNLPQTTWPPKTGLGVL